MDSIEQICDLSETQKKKLQLAGRGDIKRFFDSVGEAKMKFNALKDDQNKRNQIWQFIQPLRMKLNTGIFDENSLLHKIRTRTLKPEQMTAYDIYVGSADDPAVGRDDGDWNGNCPKMLSPNVFAGDLQSDHRLFDMISSGQLPGKQTD